MYPIAPLARIIAEIFDRAAARKLPERERREYLQRASRERLTSGLFALFLLVALVIGFFVVAARDYQDEGRRLDQENAAHQRRYPPGYQVTPAPPRPAIASERMPEAEVEADRYPECWTSNMIEKCPRDPALRTATAAVVRRRLLPSCRFRRPEETDFCKVVLDEIVACYHFQSDDCAVLWDEIETAKREQRRLGIEQR